MVASDWQEGDNEGVIFIQGEDTNQKLKKNSGASSVAKSPEIVLSVGIIIFITTHNSPLWLVLETGANTGIGIARMISMVSIVKILSAITSTLAVPGPSIWLEHSWVDPKLSAASVGASIHIIIWWSYEKI